jgi:response regulator RpfG family c-di-GMP phosphodiesterase
MAEKILFVDDEAPVLEGYQRALFREFNVDTAVGGEQGLNSIRDNGPYSVVVSDMRMPGMNGAQFLARVRQKSPDTVRILLTGYASVDGAIEAVNDGNIFRFLTKPCAKEELSFAINAGLVQYRLATVEKELLENTLMGSIKVLTEVLSAASPEAFGRSMRIAHYVRHLVAKFELPSAWRFEAAAMLSQLGCVTLDSELIKMSYVGASLSQAERARFAAHPQVARNLLVKIPRLESIAWMISQQMNLEIIGSDADGGLRIEDEILLGAKILKLAVAMDNLRMWGLSCEEATAKIRARQGEFGLELIEALADFIPDAAAGELRKITAAHLTTGMILQQEVKTRSGMLVVPNGQEITQALLVKLNNYARAGTISKDFVVLVPE